MKTGPDFLCIGQQKAGTRYLYDLLLRDSRFAMAPIKEFHHFDDPSQKVAEITRRHTGRVAALLAGPDAGDTAELDREQKKRRRHGLPPLRDDDIDFLRRYQNYLAGGYTDAAYLAAFGAYPDHRATGDITPRYSTLPPEQVRGVRDVVPDASILLVIRDPVDRIWSALNMMLNRKLPNNGRGGDPETMQQELEDLFASYDYVGELIQSPYRRSFSFPTAIYTTWAEVFGADRVRVLEFRRLTRAPAETVDLVAAALGLAPRLAEAPTAGTKPSASPKTRSSLFGRIAGRPAPQKKRQKSATNRKARKPRIELSAENRARLVAYFSEELDECQRLFGETVASWRPSEPR